MVPFALWDGSRPWYRQRLLAVLVVPTGLLLLAGLFVVTYLVAVVPLPEDVVPQATRVLDRGGKEVGTLSPVAGAEAVELSSLPEHVPGAVLAAEDRTFYSHAGVSLRGTLRALFTNVRAGDIEQGGSTITQQYIKNAAVGTERSFVRKAKEAVLALKLERQYSKDDILEFYLNTVYLGRGAHGIESAAETYFDRPAAELDVNQAALLAGMIAAPERFDPADDPGAARLRRDYTLEGMVAVGVVSETEAAQLRSEPLPDTTDRQRVDHGTGAYYLDLVRRQLTAELGSEGDVYRGLTVTTEMDLRLQEVAEAVLRRKLGELTEEIGPDRMAAFEQLSGAIVTVDPNDGGVRALVGGPDFARQQVNAATAANQPGSAFKPFGLAAFVDEGHDPRRSSFPAPAQTTVEFDGGQEYEVHNFGDRGYGTQTVFEATLTSTNTVYVQLAAEVGPDKVAETAERAGIDGELEPLPSLILGSVEVTPIDMAEAYATFAAAGVRSDARLIAEVRDASGEVVFAPQVRSEGVIDSNVAFVVSDALKANIERGTGTRAEIGRPAAGKTGTTDDNADAWFVGYVPQLSTAVWFGDLAGNTSMGDITGGSIPAETWGEYMAEAVKNLEVEDFPEPDYSALEAARTVRRPPPPPTSTPTPTPTPTPVATTCPDGQGGLVETLLLPGEPCPTPTSTPSPSPTGTGPTTPTTPTETAPTTPTETGPTTPTETETGPGPQAPAGRQPSPTGTPAVTPGSGIS